MIATYAGLAVTILVAATTLVKLLKTDKKVQQVHVLVNSQLSTVLARVTQLTGSLEKAGVEVPPKPEAAP